VATEAGALFAFVRLLSGKPITQGPHDLWSQLALLNAEQYSYYGFQARFCEMGGWQGKQVQSAPSTPICSPSRSPR
jgi:hypothetical protein